MRPFLPGSPTDGFIVDGQDIIAMPRRRSVAREPAEITMTGYEVVEKVAKKCATSARILVPRHWTGKRVRAVRLDL